MMPLRLPPWVQSTRSFQDYALVNKAVLETVGVDIPRIGLARNPAERKEIIFRQSVILFSAFILAPVHAWLFVKHFSHRYKFNSKLMAMSFKDLISPEKMRYGLRQLAATVTNESKGKIKLALPISQGEALREKLIKAKSNLLIFDLMIEGLIFANLGWITNAFGKLITGKRQFTGEMGVVSQEKLDKLYSKENERKNKWERYLPLITSGMAILAPTVLGLMLKKRMLNPVLSGGKPPVLQKVAHWFDYKKGYILGLIPLFLIGVMSDVGELMAARSNNERREKLLKNVPLTLVFMFGDTLWMKLISGLFMRHLKLPALSSIAETVELAKPGLKKKAAIISARLYWLSFILNTITVAAVIASNNSWTTRKVKDQAARLDTDNIKSLVQPKRYFPSFQPNSFPTWIGDKPMLSFERRNVPFLPYQ